MSAARTKFDTAILLAKKVATEASAYPREDNSRRRRFSTVILLAQLTAVHGRSTDIGMRDAIVVLAACASACADEIPDGAQHDSAIAAVAILCSLADAAEIEAAA